MVNRILRDDPSKGDMHNRQALSWKMVIDCLSDCQLTLFLDLLCPNKFQYPKMPPGCEHEEDIANQRF